MANVHIIGAGAWGTALALTAYRAGSDVTLYAKGISRAEHLRISRENSLLPGVEIPASIVIESDFKSLVDADGILIVLPSQEVESLCMELKAFLPPTIPLVLCSKGIEMKGENRLLSQVVREHLENPILILSGPNLAKEIAKGLPAATTIAGDLDKARLIAGMLHHSHFRCYLSPDVIGTQVGGALKNVISIGCGIVYGMGWGQNAIATLLSLGLMEIRRLGTRLGATSETFLGLSGVGDLTVTCSSELSRNFSLGAALGRGEHLRECLSRYASVPEGVHTVQAIHHLSRRLGLFMPLCETVHKVLYEDMPPQQAFEQTLHHPISEEIS